MNAECGMRNEKLLPCPFCGCSDISIYESAEDQYLYRFFVECDGCGAELSRFESREKAVEGWNMRVPEALQ